VAPDGVRRPTLTPVPYCQLAGFEQSSSPLYPIYAFLLVETKESHITLCSAFHIWKPLVPGSAPKSWTPLVLTYGGRNCLLLRFSLPTHIRIPSSATYSLIYLFIYLFLLFLVAWDWVYLVHQPLTAPLYQPRMIDDKCGAVGRMRIDRGNRSTRRKPAPVPLCSPQIPHDPSRRCGKPATNRLSYDTTYRICSLTSSLVNKQKNVDKRFTTPIS
jgi:hypothetical protein